MRSFAADRPNPEIKMKDCVLSSTYRIIQTPPKVVNYETNHDDKNYVK